MVSTPPAQSPAEQHKKLRSILCRIEELFEFMEDPSARRPLQPALEVLVSSLSTELHRHFKTEEQGGYFAEALSAAPWLKRDFERLHAEHAEFLTELSALRSLIQSIAECREKARTEFHQWALRLRAHEQAEDRLTRDAFNRDLGGG